MHALSETEIVDMPRPNPACAHESRRQQGHVRAIATYLTPSGQRHIFRGHTGATRFSETRAPVFCDLRPAEDKGMMALKRLLVRVDLTGIGFGRGGTVQTVLAWLKRAAEKADEVKRHVRRTWPVTP